jgi:O-antigen/teichoic acid export membrane protein
MSPPPDPPALPERPLGGLVKHSAIYSAAPILRQCISIGMTRLYTGWLGTAGFGVKEIVDLWLIALQQLLGQNVLSAMVRLYFDQRSEAERGRIVTSCTLVVTAAALLVCAAALAFSPTLAPWMLGRGEAVDAGQLVSILQLVFLLVPFQLASLSGFYYLMIQQRSGLYTAVQTAKLLFEVGLNFVLIGGLDLGVRGFMLSMLAGELVTACSLSGWMLWTLRPRFEWSALRPVLVYAAPLIPVGLLQLCLHNLDRRLILHFSEEGSGQSMTGIYGLGYKISYLVTTMLLGPFIQIWQPWIFRVQDEGERARLVARVGTYAILAVALASLGVILFGRQAAILLSGERPFWQAYRVIPFVASGYVFWALYHVSQTPLFIAKHTGRLFLVNLLAVALNVGLNVWLIPRFGILGAALATLVTFAVLAGLGVLAGRRAAGVTFELARLARILACVLLGAALALWIDTREDGGALEPWAAWLLKAATLSGSWAGLWLGVLRPAERARFARWIAARRRAAGGSTP